MGVWEAHWRGAVAVIYVPICTSDKYAAAIGEINSTCTNLCGAMGTLVGFASEGLVAGRSQGLNELNLP